MTGGVQDDTRSSGRQEELRMTGGVRDDTRNSGRQGVEIPLGTAEVGTAGLDQLLRPSYILVDVVDSRLGVFDFCRDGLEFLYGFVIVKLFHFSGVKDPSLRSG